MRRFSLAAAVFLLTTPGLILADAARKSADGVEFPDVIQKPLPFVLPGIAACLGQKPEDAIKEKIYSFESEKPPAKNWRELLRTKYEIRFDPSIAGFISPEALAKIRFAPESRWICRGAFGADFEVFNLTDGRISEVTFVFPRLTFDRAKSMLAPLQKVGKMSPEWHWIIKDVNLQLMFAGKRSQEGAPTCQGFTLRIDPLDWYITLHEPDPELVTALRRGVPLKGMTKDAAVAMFDPRRPFTKLPNGEANKETIVWEWRKVDMTGADSTEAWLKMQGPGYVYRRVTMTFTDGVCTEVLDESKK